MGTPLSIEILSQWSSSCIRLCSLLIGIQDNDKKVETH